MCFLILGYELKQTISPIKDNGKKGMIITVSGKSKYKKAQTANTEINVIIFVLNSIIDKAKEFLIISLIFKCTVTIIKYI